MNKKTLLVALVLYLVAAGASYAGFTYLGGSGGTTVTTTDSTETTSGDETALSSLLNIDPSEPKDQPCPLNGAMYTATEKAAWEKRRPLAVMIENTPDARPQSGMSKADVVFEAVAEGGVTRFMGMFYCGVQAADTTLAPIRSARTYYINLASGFNLPLYVHVGGANVPGPTNALGQLDDYGWTGRNDLNQFSIGYPTFVRDYNRVPGKEIATEHTMVTSTEKLWAVGLKRGWTNMSPTMKVGKKEVPGTDWKAGYKGWTFEDGKAGSGAVPKIAYDFWSGYQDYAVEWNYDTATNSYKRSHGGEVHTDLNDGSPVMAKNVIVLLTTEKGPINEKKHMLYETEGTGKALLFKNGEAKEITWSKKTRESELEFLDKGQPVALNRGLTWISLLSKTSEVTY
jgi:hypothetical protein